ncbi:DNA cytosine methyltransferase [Chromobacterium sp. IIBBL 290-4]|uniref:DNA cytosine methyltransferase n=1 Tax=Chromobacterium sp. IIBBL 290-4 TaxID=2953890 RepID=UPI0020B7817E|nr:DNA cytosine methyltransferase [Chromobacterium sp. IIBBL 290-4]UTH73745.1 DNA cytosine methyltransferase [Chromobacterium sp. IIBBL 290-4]
MIRFGSVCSGIEAASVAWHPLGWRAAWLAEIEPFPSAVLAHHYSDTPNLGDMTTIARRVLVGEVEAPELFVGGTPCQAFSVAGLREGLADERGALTIKYVELADAIDFIRRRRREPEAVIVWENVPGVLSSRDNAFGCFLGALAGESCELQPSGKKWTNAGCVFGPARAVAWRILDAQYFGVAQRRRRVFVVASARKGFDPAAVLFEFDGVRRDTAPSREAGEEVAGALTSSLGRRCGVPDGGGTSGLLQPVVGTSTWPVSHCLNAGAMGRIDFETETMVVHQVAGTLQAGGKAAGSATQQDAESGLLIPVAVAGTLTGGARKRGGYSCDDAPIVVHGTQDPDVSINLAHTLGRNQGQENAVLSVALRGRDGGATAELGDDVAGCLRASSGGGDKPHVLAQMRVRRLTPTECERLQGFPDGYTDVPFRDKSAADGPRYKAIGNSKAVPCVAWLGRRIEAALRCHGFGR